MKYKGYTVLQSPYNNHITIRKDSRTIAHVNCTEKKTDEELKEILEFALKMME